MLANVAGIMDHFVPLGELDDALWDRVIAVNLTAVMRMTRAVIPIMQAAGGGAIVTVASKASLGAGASGVSYTASKHAVIGLVEHVAYFYGPTGIRSNAVLPGTGVATGHRRHRSAHRRRGPWSGRCCPWRPWARPPSPDQIASAISWIGSDEAANVNGAVLASDGGWSAA